QRDLQGLWSNQLGSNMTILDMNTAGTFSGSHQTAVAATNKQILVSPLRGLQQHPSAKRHPTCGFTVQWQFSAPAGPIGMLTATTPLDSTAVFVGQCFNGDDGKEVLHTSWLLREKVDSESDDWKATR
ncbi:AVID protein, partial [Vidua chalybeata]|nr:AVID protein [Vidua chalybeata]